MHREGGGKFCFAILVEAVLLEAPGNLEAWGKGRSAVKAQHPRPQMILLYLRENTLGGKTLSLLWCHLGGPGQAGHTAQQDLSE